MERKLQRMTPIQLQMLVDILSVNPELISGKLTSNFTQEDRRNKWQALATLLNSKDLGPQKDADRWRKSWTDLKFAIRSKASKIELAGGANLICTKLTNLEKRVLKMIGDVSTISSSEGSVEESINLIHSIPKDVKTEYELELNEMKKKLAVSTAVIGDSKVSERSSYDKTDLSLNDVLRIKYTDNNAEEEEIDDYDDKDNSSSDDESAVNNLNEFSSTPPSKRRRVSSESTLDSKLVIETVQKQMEVQNTVLREQTTILKNIAKSLQSIAKALQER